VLLTEALMLLYKKVIYVAQDISKLTISSVIDRYLKNIQLARSENTANTYRNAMKRFAFALTDHKLPPDETELSKLPVDAIAWLATELKNDSPATEQLYLSATAGLYEYIAAEDLASPNLSRMRMLIRQRARRVGQRLPQFPRTDIERVLNYAMNLPHLETKTEAQLLRNLRDRAFLITLADTGLRVHEACELRRGDVDWNEGKAVIIGKGDRQAVIRFSTRSMKALREYLGQRAKLDGRSGRSLASLPLFARHDKGAGKKILPITTTTGRNIVAQRVREALGDEAQGTITPHSFRHYFVTTVLRGSGGNLKLAQKLARHRNISVTQRYAHLSDDELDQGYWEIFEES
jgi:site-specific recombinase XerD